jgi:hypothetical protein
MTERFAADTTLTAAVQLSADWQQLTIVIKPWKQAAQPGQTLTVRT